MQSLGFRGLGSGTKGLGIYRGYGSTLDSRHKALKPN